MNTQEIIDYIANAQKKTPVKLYTDETIKTKGECQVFNDLKLSYCTGKM